MPEVRRWPGDGRWRSPLGLTSNGGATDATVLPLSLPTFTSPNLHGSFMVQGSVLGLLARPLELAPGLFRCPDGADLPLSV